MNSNSSIWPCSEYQASKGITSSTQYDQTDNKSSGKRAASGLVLTDLALWSLTGLKLFLVGENPLSGEGEVGPGVRIVPSPCSHNAWLMTACRAPVTLQDGEGKKKKNSAHPTHTHKGAGWLCCHGNPILQLSSVHQFPQQHHKVGRGDNYFRHNTVERVEWKPY